ALVGDPLEVRARAAGRGGRAREALLVVALLGEPDREALDGADLLAGEDAHDARAVGAAAEEAPPAGVGVGVPWAAPRPVVAHGRDHAFAQRPRELVLGVVLVLRVLGDVIAV